MADTIDRAPTVAEFLAHHEAHGAGPAYARISWWLVCAPRLRLARVTVVNGHPLYTMSGDDWPVGPTRWRPLTAEGDPAPWPEVTP